MTAASSPEGTDPLARRIAEALEPHMFKGFDANLILDWHAHEPAALRDYFAQRRNARANVDTSEGTA